MLEKYKKFFRADRFSGLTGIEILGARPGYAKTMIHIGEQHLNGAGVLHGGMIFTLADFAVAVASNSYGYVTLSVNASVSFFAGCDSGIVIAEAKEISRSNKLCTYDVNVYDESGKLLANTKVTSYITPKEIEF